MWSSFAYHEPSATQIIILLSFLLLLNLFGKLAQVLISAGLLGQILIGIIYGTPLAGILEDSWEEAIVAIGYVGLLLVVFEGGMSSSIANLRSCLPYSVAIALTGLLTPIALSFILMPLQSAPPLHAFAAGSALSSTSLGTVLAVLQPATIGFDLRKTGFGTALLSAAVMDDIVAFILVKVLSILGSSAETSGSSLGGSIGRAIGVTVGIGIALAMLARWVLKPGLLWLYTTRQFTTSQWGGERTLLVLMALLFIGMVAAAGYGGTSPLYGAYIAGLAVAYLSDFIDHGNDDPAMQLTDKAQGARLERSNTFPPSRYIPPSPLSSMTASQDHQASAKTQRTLIGAFEHYITPVLTYILLPLFFGSIGYSIPFVPLWRGRIVWRGIIYALLMLLGKAFCGCWLLLRGLSGWRAAGVLGLAMISRGEIGLLIAQVARGTDEALLDEDEFLIVVWAIVLCTIVGPMSVGWGVKKWGKGILQGGWE